MACLLELKESHPLFYEEMQIFPYPYTMIDTAHDVPSLLLVFCKRVRKSSCYSNFVFSSFDLCIDGLQV